MAWNWRKECQHYFADADLERAVDKAIFGAFYNQGEVCSANSRILLEKSIAQQFIEKFVAKAKNLVVGDPLDPNTNMGCLIDRKHAQNVRAAIDQAKLQGAQCHTIELQLDAYLDVSTYVAPTVLIGIDPNFNIFH